MGIMKLMSLSVLILINGTQTLLGAGFINGIKYEKQKFRS